MKFLNGWKTVVGIVGTIGTVLVASGGKIGGIASTAVQVFGHLDSVVAGVFGALAVLGVIHKVEKGKQ